MCFLKNIMLKFIIENAEHRLKLIFFLIQLTLIIIFINYSISISYVLRKILVREIFHILTAEKVVIILQLDHITYKILLNRFENFRYGLIK